MSSLHTSTINASATTPLRRAVAHPNPFRWQYDEFDDSSFQIGRRPFFIIVLFAVVLVLILIILYARWVCRYRPRSVRSFHALPLPHQPPAPQQGLHPAVIDSLPIVLHGATGGNLGNVECCICLSVFQDGEKVKVLPECRHCFHSDCVDKWLKTHSSCPLCRVSPRFDSAV